MTLPETGRDSDACPSCRQADLTPRKILLRALLGLLAKAAFLAALYFLVFSPRRF